LVVAGVEAHYPDCAPGGHLGPPRRLTRELGIEDRVRLILRFLENAELSELMKRATSTCCRI
jgi:hypothetical protein